MLDTEPNAVLIVRAQRAFLGRAVRFAVSAGIRQFLDIGSGIPTEQNVREVSSECTARKHAPVVRQFAGMLRSTGRSRVRPAHRAGIKELASRREQI